jgi:hypothetical protein
MREYSPTVRHFKDKSEIDQFWKDAPEFAWSVAVGHDSPNRKELLEKQGKNPEKPALHTVIWLPETCEIIDLTAFQATRNKKNLWVHPYWTSVFDLTLLRTPVCSNREKILLEDHNLQLPNTSYEIDYGAKQDISPLVWFQPMKQTGKLWYKTFESVEKGETSILLSACLIMISKATMQKCPSRKQIEKWTDQLIKLNEMITIDPQDVTGIDEAMQQILIMGGYPHLPVKAVGGETLNNVNKLRSAYGMEPL